MATNAPGDPRMFPLTALDPSSQDVGRRARLWANAPQFPNLSGEKPFSRGPANHRAASLSVLVDQRVTSQVLRVFFTQQEYCKKLIMCENNREISIDSFFMVLMGSDRVIVADRTDLSCVLLITEHEWLHSHEQISIRISQDSMKC